MTKPLPGFKETFTGTDLHNLFTEMQQHMVIVQPETAIDTKFGFFIENPANEHEMRQAMGEAQSLMSLLAVEHKDEKNLFDRIMRNAEITKTSLDIVTGDVLLDRFGNAQCVNQDGQVISQMAVTGFACNNQAISTVFFYPRAKSMVLADFQAESFTRITMIPKELIQ